MSPCPPYGEKPSAEKVYRYPSIGPLHLTSWEKSVFFYEMDGEKRLHRLRAALSGIMATRLL
ncbi:hypothetical protein [Dickeya lacustris]|uniref:Uncharacterized protein n=1 Tax=Dickeya lacustris TaxID=2259638 RepID=A0ABY8GAP9_9GAMM|nr:hypothetical protein [Dickeya lacustris]WFN57011.1 hypothetical protein O1Q98_07240 [Dickeya lacustris]